MHESWRIWRHERTLGWKEYYEMVTFFEGFATLNCAVVELTELLTFPYTAWVLRLETQ